MNKDKNLDRRQFDCSSYSNEYLALLFKDSETISILKSHLINGYQSFHLISQYFCHGQCSIKSQLKFIENPKTKLNEKSFLSFMKTFSILSCFYGIYPGELSELYLLTYYLIYFYISILILDEKKEFRKLMQIFGLHPIIYWTSTFIFHFILTLFYSIFIYFIYSLNDNHLEKENKFEEIIKKNNLIIKEKFFQLNLILSITILPFIYLITS